VAIAIYCNLKPPDAAQVILRFKYDAQTEVVNLSSQLTKFSLLIPYVTL